MENKIDTSHLLEIFGGDEALAQRFLELFKSEMPGQLTSLETQILTGDLGSAHISAHSIKAQLKMLGLEEIAQSAWRIEAKTEGLGNMSKELLGEFESLKSEIGKLL